MIHYCLPEARTINLTFLQILQPMTARFCGYQIARLREFAPTELHIKLTNRKISRVFDVNNSAIQRAFQPDDE
jgi:hypothetical protein